MVGIVPLYFFHVRDGSSFSYDPEGAEFPDLKEAHAEARYVMRDLAITALRDGSPVTQYQVEVSDNAGDVLGIVRFQDISEGTSNDIKSDSD